MTRPAEWDEASPDPISPTEHVVTDFEAGTLSDEDRIAWLRYVSVPGLDTAPNWRDTDILHGMQLDL